jgi:hypothetical protein
VPEWTVVVSRVITVGLLPPTALQPVVLFSKPEFETRLFGEQRNQLYANVAEGSDHVPGFAVKADPI